jgi:dipeptidyl aminopeptidase/acylaminoacyl peptidase
MVRGSKTGVKVAPFGAWASPITADLLLKDRVNMRNQMLRWDGDDLYWSELRPSEQGRVVVCRRNAEGEVSDVTPTGFNARTRVHEYGGGHFAVRGGTVWFTNFSDQRLYRQEGSAAPRPITRAADIRYADMEVDERRGLLFTVCEDHTTGAAEAVNTLVAIDADGRSDPVTIASGNDFYSSPKLSTDGKQLAWTTWNHPNMPWDGSELWAAELGPDGRITSSRKVAGGPAECVLQPEWAPDGALYFVSDRSDWWNIYRTRGEGDEAVCPKAAEFGAPQWAFGMRFYDLVSADEMVCIWSDAAGSKLGTIDLRSGTPKQVELLYTSLNCVQVRGRTAAVFAGTATLAERVLTVELDSGAQEVIRVSNPAHFDAGHLSLPKPIAFPTEGGLTAHAIYYPPKNRDFEAPEGEKPPLIVSCHGGPTGTAGQLYPFEYQYWTSRGIAIVDVNYGGSAGYGRAYRARLNGNWGVVDVDDCLNAARYLVARGLADKDRVAITGGSAGGFTVLLSLTKRTFYGAGASHYGIGDLESFARETHKFESHYLETLVGRYPEKADLYRDRSAVNFADNLNCPVILFQGLEDKVVPPSQAEEFVEVCKKKKLPYAYVAFEGEQHGFRKEENIRRSIEGEMYFFARVFAFTPFDKIEPVPIENL